MWQFQAREKPLEVEILDKSCFLPAENIQMGFS